ncbi:protein-S-isoprenylcysteine O-methyltransferase Ste14 [Bradyrhizobium sp. i1.7.7]
MGRLIAFLYGLISYAVFFVTFLYAIGFVSDLVVPKAIDDGTSTSTLASLVIDVAADVTLCDSAQRDGSQAVQRMVDAVCTQTN